MSTLTLGEARSLIETDLNDTALQLIIDDAEAEIVERVGAIDAQTDEFAGSDLTSLLFLSRKASSITSITEKVVSISGYTSTTLGASDYWLRQNSRIVERLSTGTNARSTWGDRVTIVYVPQDDTKRRKMVTVDLVKLAIVNKGIKSHRIGDYSEEAKAYDEERSLLIDRLRNFDL